MATPTNGGGGRGDGDGGGGDGGGERGFGLGGGGGGEGGGGGPGEGGEGGDSGEGGGAGGGGSGVGGGGDGISHEPAQTTLRCDQTDSKRLQMPGVPLSHASFSHGAKADRSPTRYSEPSGQRQPPPQAPTPGASSITVLRESARTSGRSPDGPGASQCTSLKAQMPSPCWHSPWMPPRHAIESQLLPSSPAVKTCPSGHVHLPPHTPIGVPISQLVSSE